MLDLESSAERRESSILSEPKIGIRILSKIEEVNKFIEENKIVNNQPFYIKGCVLNNREEEVRKIKEDFKEFPDLSGKTLIEIGCSTGMNLFTLSELYPDAILRGIDKNEKAISIANLIKESSKKYSNIQFIHKDFHDKEIYNIKYNYMLISDLPYFFYQFYSMYRFIRRKIKKSKNKMPVVFLKYPSLNYSMDFTKSKIRNTKKTLKSFKNSYLIGDFIVIKNRN